MHNYPNIELLMVVVIIPAIGNTLCFWITDNFLQAEPAKV